MNKSTFNLYWNDIPTEKEKAVSYIILQLKWSMNAREVRSILHDLSAYDNGDDYVLIRSSRNKGFYKTTDKDEISAYKKEILSKGMQLFAPLKKMNRITKNNEQLSFLNNLKAKRIECHLGQPEAVAKMKIIDKSFDVSMLSKMENGKCIPNPKQLLTLAKIYACKPFELINTDLYQ